MTAIKDDYYHVGLTDEQVRKSRDEHGVNLLTPPKRPSLWKLYLEKFEDPGSKGIAGCRSVFFDYFHCRE